METNSKKKELIGTTTNGKNGSTHQIPEEFQVFVKYGFAIIKINRYGQIVSDAGTADRILKNLGISTENNLSLLEPDFSRYLWGKIEKGGGRSSSIQLFEPFYEYGYTGAVLISEETDTLWVCLVSLESIGLEIDSLWGQMLKQLPLISS